MQMLLTPGQESSMKTLSKNLVTESGSYYYQPYILKELGDNIYEFIKFEELPEDAKDCILAYKGIKIPV